MLLSCLSEIQCWMSQNFLQLHENQSLSQFYKKHVLALHKPAAGNLGVIFDLSFEKQVVQCVFLDWASKNLVFSFSRCSYTLLYHLDDIIVICSFRVEPINVLTPSAGAKRSCSAFNKCSKTRSRQLRFSLFTSSQSVLELILRFYCLPLNTSWFSSQCILLNCCSPARVQPQVLRRGSAGCS